MKMRRDNWQTIAQLLGESLRNTACPSDHCFYSIDRVVRYVDILNGSSLAGQRDQFTGRSVLIHTNGQLAAAIALIELDGRARRMILATPDVHGENLTAIIEEAEVDAVIADHESPETSHIDLRVRCSPSLTPAPKDETVAHRTEWILLTSGTTGTPKLVIHSLKSLTAAIATSNGPEEPITWATFYDIRRYGGLQFYLRAVLAARSLVLSDKDEALEAHLTRLNAQGATHITGTPSHWRRILWSPLAKSITPNYVRMSGEIVDQAIIDNLRATYPGVPIGHAYAATEAGVGFTVNDCLEGFPAEFIDKTRNGVTMKIVDGSLRIRSPGLAAGYLGHKNVMVLDDEGFLDTGDLIERRGDRCYFMGRKGGIINVGGLKVYPEEVEAVINRHPDVRISRVRGKKNPIVGFIVTADVVVAADNTAGQETDRIKREITELCRKELASHKVPAAVNFVPSLPVTSGGKLVRANA
jgi:acyl-coenzyme A synthetase/AMP-(fatty) acid ligase